MLASFKRLYLSARISSARADLRLSIVGLRDKSRQVHMHADRLEALLEKAGDPRKSHLMRVEADLAREEAGRRRRESDTHLTKE